jgi:hypothetical protein
MSYVGGTIAAERSFSFLATCNRTQINNCTHKKIFGLDYSYEFDSTEKKKRISTKGVRGNKLIPYCVCWQAWWIADV